MIVNILPTTSTGSEQILLKKLASSLTTERVNMDIFLLGSYSLRWWVLYPQKQRSIILSAQTVSLFAPLVRRPDGSRSPCALQDFVSRKGPKHMESSPSGQPERILGEVDL